MIAIGCPVCMVRKAIQRPAAHDRIRQVVHAAPNPAPAPDRQINNKGRRQPVRGVVRTDPMLGLQIVQQLGIVELQIRQPRISSRRGIVGRLRERVVPLEADVVARPLLESNLQRVVPRGCNQARQTGKSLPRTADTARNRSPCGIWSCTYSESATSAGLKIGVAGQYDAGDATVAKKH